VKLICSDSEILIELRTGTTLLLLPSNGFTAYTRATGAVADRTTGLLRITAAQFANLQSLFFTTSKQQISQMHPHSD
jgi:hypothetical protein